MPYKYKPSLYLTLALTIMFSVLVVLALHTRTSYNEIKSKTLAQMENKSTETINLLIKNISSDLETYSINNYNKTLLNQMRVSNYIAIVVKDYNMGEIIGDKAYISGVIRKNNKIIDFDHNNIEHNKVIKKAYMHKNKDIISSGGKVIGNINVYISDKELQKKLDELILASILDFFLVSSILIITLFIAIYMFIVKPISVISHTINQQDEYGIPTGSLSQNGPKEISRLSQTINFMLDSIKKSRLKISEQNKQLRYEKDRFELAVDGTEDGLWDWDIQNNTIVFSDRFYNMLGYEKSDISNEIDQWNKLVHPEDRANAAVEVESYLDQRGSQKYENTYRMIKKDGSYIWVTSRGKALFDEDGKAVRFVGFITDITKQVQHNKELEYTAKHDLLTGLPNRFLFSEYIQDLMEKTTKNNTHMALLYIDLDGFKEINDRFGHELGDKTLIQVSKRIKNTLRKEDFVARIGGDEFVVAIANIDPKSDIAPIFNNFLETLEQNVINPKDKTESILMTASIGSTFYPQSEEIGPEALLRQADQAMYDAKKLGKNQYHIFNLDIDASSKEHLRIIQDFELSLKNNDFLLYYQPKVDMRTNKIIGFETLLRWQHPQKGLMFPDQFLPVVNPQKELMLLLGEWVISNAFKQYSKWREDGYDFMLSINISAHEFKEAKTFSLLRSLLKKYPNISAKDVEFEILETHAFDDITQANKMISTFKELGFQIALDDFGTGYSTLSYLKDLSINTLKIDKSFVMDMLHDRASLSILEATIALAEAFRCNVIAEGVESEEHGNVLIQLGCYQAQGYVLSKPMSPEQVKGWIGAYKGPVSWEENSKKFFHEHSSLYALVEHKEWIKSIENYVDDPKLNPFNKEISSDRCNFYKWLSGDAKKHFSNQTLQDLNALHNKIHKLAYEIINTDQTNDKKLLEEIEKIHKEMVEILKSQNSL